MKRIIRYDFLGFLIASRIPNLFIIGATQYLTAILLVSDFPHKYDWVKSWHFFIMAISTGMIAAAGYIINDYYDQKIDMINRPDKVVVGTMFRRRLALLAHGILTILAIGMGFYLGIKMGAIYLFAAFSLWYYSNYLRRITLIGNLIIAFLTGLTLLMVPIYFDRNEPMVYVYSLFAMAITLIREVLKDIEDLKGDSAFGCQSIPVIFGIRGAKFFIYAVSLGSAAMLVTFLIALDNWTVRFYFMALLPVFIEFIFRLYQADRRKEYTSLITFTNLIIFSGLISMILIKVWG